MDATGTALWHASVLVARASNSTSSSSSSSTTSGRPSAYKAVGICLAVASGFFIGTSFVLKKTGLLKANVKYNEEAGEGYGYLKNVWWWSGMTLMIIGEICNFVAYAFVDAILVTPLGALSVVITTILSAIFLKERLSFVGKVGCFSCIIGSIVIPLNAPRQSSVSNIQEMQNYVIAPGFLSYAGVIIVGSVFTAFWAGPRYGKKSMFVYLSICSMIGGLSVVATQGLGAAILAQINGQSQFTHWFLYVLFVFVICTLLTEIIYLNKALNIFNAALVTPTYYVFFTSATIVTSAILFQGFNGSGMEIATVVLGFLQICVGVVLLQLSKSAKDVPDAAVFKGDLDQIREVVTQEEPETEPKADSIRGTAAIIRRISTARRTMAAEEARRFFHEKRADTLAPPTENEIIEWDGLRRRKTVIGVGPTMASRPHTPRTPSFKQQLPPWGMSRFPDPEPEDQRPSTKQSGQSFLGGIRSRASSVVDPTQWRRVHGQDEKHLDPNSQPVSMTDLAHRRGNNGDTAYHGAGGLGAPFQQANRERSDTPRSIAWADENTDSQQSQHLEAPRQTARRQFSFNSMIQRIKAGREPSPKPPSSPPRGILRRTHMKHGSDNTKSATEEEQLGLVRGDSRVADSDEEGVTEKTDRWSSSQSDLGEPRPLYARAHGSSVSSISTSAFPPYEDHHHSYFSAAHQHHSSTDENPYFLPPIRQSSSPGSLDGEEEGRQVPTARSSRTESPSHHHHPPRAPPPSQSSFSTHRHPNPLPPLPDEPVPVPELSGVRSTSSESDLGVTSLPDSGDSQDSDSRPAQRPAQRRPNTSDGS